MQPPEATPRARGRRTPPRCVPAIRAAVRRRTVVEPVRATLGYCPPSADRLLAPPARRAHRHNRHTWGTRPAPHGTIELPRGDHRQETPSAPARRDTQWSSARWLAATRTMLAPSRALAVPPRRDHEPRAPARFDEAQWAYRIRRSTASRSALQPHARPLPDGRERR